MRGFLIVMALLAAVAFGVYKYTKTVCSCSPDCACGSACVCVASGGKKCNDGCKCGVKACKKDTCCGK